MTQFKKGNTIGKEFRFKKGHKTTRAVREKISKSLRGLRGNRARRWKGGETTDWNGYVWVLNHQHPYKNKDGYVKRSVLVMEKHIGRYLNKDETVHHIDRNRDNDDIQNLYLMNKRQHAAYHRREYLTFKKWGIEYKRKYPTTYQESLRWGEERR